MLGPVMLDLEGHELSTEEREILQHPQVGGVILFARNYDAPQQLQDLLRQVREHSHTKLLIAVDHEGGRVQRFRSGFTQLPALRLTGQQYEQNTVQANILALQHAWLMATELLAAGVDFSFAPVLDLDKGISAVIGDRAFHREPAIISILAQTYLKGMSQAGMAAVGKHFPGHGSVAADSHTEIPIDERSFDLIESEDLVPFAQTMMNLAGIMPAHVIYADVDPLPAGFSTFWLQRVLRDQLGFTGAIFSDDLSMAGASFIGDVPTRAQVAIEAGCDMVLVCNDRLGALEVLAQLEQYPIERDPASLSRLQNMFGQQHLTHQELSESPRWQQANKMIQQFS